MIAVIPTAMKVLDGHCNEFIDPLKNKQLAITQTLSEKKSSLAYRSIKRFLFEKTEKSNCSIKKQMYKILLKCKRIYYSLFPHCPHS